MIPIVDLTPKTLFCNQVTADQTGLTGIDVSSYDGDAVVVVAVTPVSGTTPTIDIHLEDCATSGGTYADLSPAQAITQVTTVASIQTLQLRIGELQKYLRPYIDVGGTNPVYDVAVILLAQLKYK